MAIPYLKQKISTLLLLEWLMGTPITEAFSISLKGAMIAAIFLRNPDIMKIALDMLSNIRGLDKKSIVNACKMTTFDVWLRNISIAPMAKTADETNPDNHTIQNIQTMVNRSIVFWEKHGPIVKVRFTFEKDGYTKTVDSGDGDFLTADTIWDFKVSKMKPTSKETLQLLMYWIMGQHSGKKEFKNITNLGIFNPRLNNIYTLPISKVKPDIIEIVETEIICY